MTEKLTQITLPGADPHVGLGEFGDHDAALMISKLRRYADHLRAQVAAVDAATDDDFRIEVVRGVHVQHPVRTVQPGRPKP